MFYIFTYTFVYTLNLLTNICNTDDLQACHNNLVTLANHRGAETETRSSNRVDAARTGDSSTEKRTDDTLCHQWTTDGFP